jgi:hypothetical protein
VSFELEITPAAHASELRNGFIFVVRQGEHVACRGRMKPQTGLHFDRGSSPAPTKAIARTLERMAREYVEDGTEPEDCVFADDVPETETAPEWTEEELRAVMADQPYKADLAAWAATLGVELDDSNTRDEMEAAALAALL